MAELTVRIQEQPGPFRRELKGYVFEAANGFTAAVDIATAAELLTYPTGTFRLAEQPSAAVLKALADALGVKKENIVVPGQTPAPREPAVGDITGAERAGQLAELGVSSVAALGALDREGVERTAAATGASRAEVQAWVEQARH